MTAQYSTAQHSTAGTLRRMTAQPGTPNAAQHSTPQHSTAWQYLDQLQSSVPMPMMQVLQVPLQFCIFPLQLRLFLLQGIVLPLRLLLLPPQERLSFISHGGQSLISPCCHPIPFSIVIQQGGACREGKSNCTYSGQQNYSCKSLQSNMHCKSSSRAYETSNLVLLYAKLQRPCSLKGQVPVQAVKNHMQERTSFRHLGRKV